MADFGLAIVNDRKVILRFDQFPAAMHDRILAVMQDLEAQLEAAVIAQEPNRTGALRALTGGRVYDHGNRIAAVVGVRATTESDARKAAALEYGSHKALTVKAHSARLAHLWSRAISPIVVQVAAHGRRPNIDAKDFLRGPIQAMRAEALAALQAAVSGAVADTAE